MLCHLPESHAALPTHALVAAGRHRRVLFRSQTNDALLCLHLLLLDPEDFDDKLPIDQSVQSLDLSLRSCLKQSGRALAWSGRVRVYKSLLQLPVRLHISVHFGHVAIAIKRGRDPRNIVTWLLGHLRWLRLGSIDLWWPSHPWIKAL